jgi:hypothetical protein
MLAYPRETKRKFLYYPEDMVGSSFMVYWSFLFRDEKIKDGM